MLTLTHKLKEYMIRKPRTEVKTISHSQRTAEEEEDRSTDSMLKGICSGSNGFKSCRSEKKLTPELQSLSDRENVYSEEDFDSVHAQLDDALLKIQQQEAKISELEDALCRVHQDRVKEEELRYERSRLERKQHMGKLQSELSGLQTIIEEMRVDHRRKLKAMKEQVVLVKKDCALQLFELGQDNAQLLEENNRLRKCLSSFSPVDQVSDPSLTWSSNPQGDSSQTPEVEELALRSGIPSRGCLCTSSMSVDSGASSMVRPWSNSSDTSDVSSMSRARLVLALSERLSVLDVENARLVTELEASRYELEKLKHALPH